MTFLESERSETKKKIVNQLLDGEKSLNELSQEIGVSKQALLKHLDEMEEKGIVRSKLEKGEVGNVKKYEIGSYSKVISIDKKGFVVKYESDSPLDFHFPLTNQIPQQKYRQEASTYLKKIVPMKEDLTVIIFGSVARGEATWKSDIDIALFSKDWSKREKKEIMDKISDVAMTGKVETSLNPHFKTYKDLGGEGDLIKEIKRDGLILYTTNQKVWKIMKNYKSI